MIRNTLYSRGTESSVHFNVSFDMLNHFYEWMSEPRELVSSATDQCIEWLQTVWPHVEPIRPIFCRVYSDITQRRHCPHLPSPSKDGVTWSVSAVNKWYNLGSWNQRNESTCAPLTASLLSNRRLPFSFGTSCRPGCIIALTGGRTFRCSFT